MNEKTNWAWELSLYRQKVGEWINYQLSRWQPQKLTPDFSLSPELNKLLNIILWLGLILLTIWILWALWREFNPYIYSWFNWLNVINQNPQSPQNQHSKEISITTLLKQAREFQRQYNYSQACRCLYLAMLHHLDAQGIIGQQPSRTDGEYLQLLQRAVNLTQPYHTLITTHEKLCFSEYEALAEDYQDCWQAYQQISGT